MMTQAQSERLPPSYVRGGRANQKERTRQALLRATRELLDEGRSPTVAQAALRALVSEATAYRYYSDAQGLLRDALAPSWPDLEDVLATVRASADVAVRARRAGEAIARNVLANEARVRALICIAYSPANGASLRPEFRFRLIDAVIEPLAGSFTRADVRRLERALGIVISAEACLTLKDVCRANDKQVIESVGWTASQLVTAFMLTYRRKPR